MEEKRPQITGGDVPATWGDLKKRNAVWGGFAWDERFQNNTNSISTSQSTPEKQKR